jgi:hypothetical protein
MFFSRQDYSVFFLDANEQFKKKSYPVGPLTPIRATEKSITKFFPMTQKENDDSLVSYVAAILAIFLLVTMFGRPTVG